MSLSRAHRQNGDVNLLREATNPFSAWDIEGRMEVTLEPGLLLSRCRVRRHSQDEIDCGADAYSVEFQTGGRNYVCPLFRFQPRTRTVALDPSQTIQAVAV